MIDQSESPSGTGRIGELARWLDERAKYSGLLNFLARKKVPRHKHAFWYIFGGLSLFFLIVQAVTGILLMLYYSPTPAGAYESVETIMTKVPFGWLVRSVHSWSANLLVATVLIHLFSVFFLASYRKPRELMWFTGVGLLGIILGFAFTGYLLPWDTKAYFATQIGTEIPRSIPFIGEFVVKVLRGGEFIAGESLKRLFALHVVILPLLAAGLASLHIILNQVQGPSVPIGVQTREPAIPFYPNYMIRDLITWLTGLFFLLCLAIALPIQLGSKADAFASAPVGIKPEWYFLPLFQTLKFMPSDILGVGSETVVNLLVMAFGGALFLVPLLDRNAAGGRKSPLFTLLGVAAIAYFIMTITIAYLA